MQLGEMHNGGGAGGWGKGNTTGNGFDPEGSSDITNDEKLISQMAALDNITTVRIELIINDVPQPAIIADATTTKDVLPRMTPEDKVSGTAYITLADGTTRVAQLEETYPELGKALPFKVPYYYRCVNSSGAEIVPSTEYFSRDGIDLSGVADNTIGWLCETDGTMYNGNFVSGVRGDITLSPVYAAPNCVITVTPPGTATETASGSGIYEITNLSNSFSLLVGLADGTSFPAGTSTSWQVNGTAITNGTTPETCSAAPDDVGITEATIGSNATNASTMTINCIINIPGEPQAATTKTIKVYKKIDLPTTFSIDVTAPATASADSITADKYAVTVPADTFTFAASLSGGTTFPTGTVFNWTINAGGTSITKTGQSFTLAPSSGAALSTIYDSPTIWNIACAISHPDMANATAPSVSKPINLNQVNPPAMTVTKPGTATETATGIYKIVNMTDTFTFEATESDGSPLPTATTSFQWYVGGSPVAGETSYIFNASPTVLGLSEGTMGTNQTNATSVEVKCVVTRPNGDAPAVKTIKVFKPVTLPTSFNVTVTAPSTAGTAEPYVVYRNTDSFTFAAAPLGGGSFPTGTKFSWTITGGSSTATRSNLSTASVSIPASEFGTISTTSATPTTLTATCTIDHADKLNTAQSDDTTAQVYKFTIPAFTITFTPAAGTYDPTHSDTSGAVPLYALTDLGTCYTIEAVPTAGAFPAGTKFSWTVDGTSLSGLDGDTVDVLSFSSLGYGNTKTMSTSSTSPESIVIQCTAHDNHSPVLVTKNADNKTIKVYDLRYTVSFDTGTGGSTVASQTVAPTGTATEPADPTRTDYTFAGWYTSTDGGTTLSATPYDFTSAVYADLTLYAKWAGAVYMDTGSTIKAALIALGADAAPNKTFSASATPPAAGTTTQKLSTADSPTEVVAWLDGTTIKYYAEGYTDASPAVKIPLNANSEKMFFECEALTSIDVSGFDTSNVTSMRGMFASCSNLTSITGLDSFDTSKVTNMYAMFSECEALTSIDVSSFNTSNVANMSFMFFQCNALESITELNHFDTSNVTTLKQMFYCCYALTSIDLSSFDTSKVTDMASIFYACHNLITIYASDSFVTTSVTSSTNMFASCSTALKGGAGTTWNSSNPVDKTYARLDGGSTSSTPGYFTLKP